MQTSQQRASSPAATIALCFLVALLEGFDIQAAGVAAPKLAKSLGLSPDMLGLFFTASTAGMLLGAFIGGRASDRIGRKPVLLVSVATFGLCSVLTGLANGFGVLVAARFLTGLGMGGALPALVALVSEGDPTRKGRAVALMYAGTPFGGACSGIASALFADWQMIFHIGGFLPLFILPLLWMRLHDRRRPMVQHNQKKAGIRTILFDPSRAIETLLLWLAFFLGLLVLYVMLNWAPTLLASRGFEKSQIALFQGTLNVMGGTIVMVAASILDGPRLVPLAIATYAGTAITLLLVASMTPDYGLLPLIGIAGLFGACLLTSQSILYSTSPRVYEENIRGTGVGAALGAGRAGSITGPMLAATILSAGVSPTQLLLIAIPIAVIGGLANVALLLRVHRT